MIKKPLLLVGLLALAACGSSLPADDPIPEEFRNSKIPLTEELKNRRTEAMLSMIRATGLEPFESVLVQNASTLSVKVKGAGSCTASLSYEVIKTRHDRYGNFSERISFSFVVYNRDGVRLVSMRPVGDGRFGFEPDKSRDVKDWSQVRHCVDTTK